MKTRTISGLLLGGLTALACGTGAGDGTGIGRDSVPAEKSDTFAPGSPNVPPGPVGQGANGGGGGDGGGGNQGGTGNTGNEGGTGNTGNAGGTGGGTGDNCEAVCESKLKGECQLDVNCKSSCDGATATEIQCIQTQSCQAILSGACGGG